MIFSVRLFCNSYLLDLRTGAKDRRKAVLMAEEAEVSAIAGLGALM